MSLTAIAKAANMTSSKAHKYFASFVRAGLVSQDHHRRDHGGGRAWH
jgi:DNA-binding IclR family transcriptional regulator